MFKTFIAAVALLIASLAAAQTPTPIRLRATIAKVVRNAVDEFRAAAVIDLQKPAASAMLCGMTLPLHTTRSLENDLSA